MSRSDWAIMTGSTDGTGWGGTTILRNATFGNPNPPPGGGNALFAFNSVEPIVGSVGVYTAVSGFNPLPKGGQITGVVQRGTSGGNTGFSVALVLGASGSNVGDKAYLLGLEDQTPGRIVLAKGPVSGGIPNNNNQPATKILRTSQRTVAQNEYVHLRMDMIVQDSGDVVIKCYENDLNAHPLDNPGSWVWVPIPFDDGFSGEFGDGEFIDDVVGVNSGSVPLTSGFAGFGFECSETARRAYVDHISIVAQGN